MDSPILVAIISSAASVVVAAVTFSLTKRRERDAEWRKQKLEHYREFLDALSGIVGSDTTREGQLRWARACNTIGLVATQSVLVTLINFQDSIAASNPNRSVTDHNEKLKQLMLAIRADLGVAPNDDPTTFNFQLWCSGANN